MSRLRFSEDAQQDLRDIARFIAHDDPEAARRWVANLREKCSFLSRNPEIGERCPQFLTGKFRCFTVGRYVIFYGPVEGGIEIARVIAGDRDLGKL